MLDYNDVYVLEINNAHWEGGKGQLLEILNNYEEELGITGEDYNFIFLPLKDYNKLRYLNNLK